MDAKTNPNSASKPAVHRAVLFGINFCFWAVLLHAVVAVFDDLLYILDGSLLLAPVRLRLLLAGLAVSMALILLQTVHPRFRDRTLAVWIMVVPATLILSVSFGCLWFEWLPQFSWLLSLVALGVLAIEVRLLTGAWTWKWALVTQEHVHVTQHSWKAVWKQMVLALLILVPLSVALVVWVGVQIIERDTGGCLSFHRNRMMVHGLDYRDFNGRQVRLLPMVHFGDAAFYRHISREFTRGSTVLVEGIRDRFGICKDFMSSSEWIGRLGMVEQSFDAIPDSARFINADLDVSDFSLFTIDALQKEVGGWKELRWFLIMAHPGYRFERLQVEHFDIVTRRNQQVMRVLKTHLDHEDYFVIPWGAAHMPGLAAELEKMGFLQMGGCDFEVVRWGK